MNEKEANNSVTLYLINTTTGEYKKTIDAIVDVPLINPVGPDDIKEIFLKRKEITE